MKQNNIKIDLPGINKADYSFTPNKENNSIVYGLFAISGINSQIANDIIANRPYISLNDFLDKVRLTKSQIINLIKAGAFDDIEKRTREEIINDYIKSTLPIKSKLTSVNLLSLIEKGITKCGCLEDSCKYCLQARFIKFRKNIFNKEFKYKVENSKKDYYKLDHISEPFFEEHFMDHLKEDKHYFYNEVGELIVDKTSFDKVFKILIKDTLEWLLEPLTIKAYNNSLINEELHRTKSDLEISEMEMQSLNYYYTKHYLDGIDLSQYGVRSFFDLDEEPTLLSEKITKSGRVFRSYETCRLAGTIVQVDKNKHIIYLSTIDGVVGVKFRNKGSFIHYTKQISQIQEDGTKKVIEKPWLSRHNHVMVSGYRYGDIFYISKYQDMEHTVSKIIGKKDNKLIIQTERINID